MSKPQYTPLHPLPLRHQLKTIIVTALLVVSPLGLLASVTATLLFAPKPELETWMPDGIRCARCGEIESGEVRERVGCKSVEEFGGGVSKVSLLGGERGGGRAGML